MHIWRSPDYGPALIVTGCPPRATTGRIAQGQTLALIANASQCQCYFKPIGIQTYKLDLYTHLLTPVRRTGNPAEIKALATDFSTAVIIPRTTVRDGIVGLMSVR